MPGKKKGSGKYQSKLAARMDPRDIELFEKRYRFMQEKGIVPKAKNRSQMMRNWLDIWIPTKIMDFMMKEAIIYPEFIDGNSNIRFSYQVEQNQFSQTVQYRLI